ncbi:MAG: ATP-binding protein [Bacteroidales bacterium]|jgi:AAA15 family ATPase/GTPase|nr:ATP-binding protein [Bacteroidales bacterium]
MLVNFSIQNFCSIKDKQTLSFEADNSKHLEDYYVITANGLRLLKVGLIYGANASGKTTILKALDFLRTLVLNPKSKKTETFDLKPFLFDENTPKENTIFEIEFIQNNVRYRYKVELNAKAIVQEELFAYNPRKSTVFSRTTDAEKQVSNILFGNKVKIDKVTEQQFENITLWNNTVLGGFLKINVVLKELKDTIDWFKNYVGQLIYPNSQSLEFVEYGRNIDETEKNTIIEILKKADFNISNFEIKEDTDFFKFIKSFTNIPDSEFNEFQRDTPKIAKWIFEKGLKSADVDPLTIIFEHDVNGRKYYLDFESESLGTQRYYTFACLLSKLITNSILLPIDELESSLHPDLFQHFLLLFLTNSKKSQIIATTHNREILNDKDVFRPDVIWITDKDNDHCATELYSLSDFDSSIIRNTTNILNAYKMGKLGGVPNLSDYYIDAESYEEK